MTTIVQDVEPNITPTSSRVHTGWISRLKTIHRDRMLVFLAVIGAIALLTLLFEAGSIHTYLGNSDGATVVLEGQAMNAGHIALGGWSMTTESFWSIDALFYAVVIRFAGVGPVLLHVVPALIAAVTVAVSAYVARMDKKRTAGLAGAIAVIVLLALPSPTLAFFLLQGPWHVGTAMWSLIAIALISRQKFGWRWAVAVLFLSAGLLGDFMTAAIGVTPLFFGGLFAMARERNWRPGISSVLAAPASIAGALLLRVIASAIGTFAIASRQTVVHSSRISWNIHHLPDRFAALLGFGVLPNGISAGSRSFQDVHLVGVTVVSAAVLWTLFRTVQLVIISSRHAEDSSPSLTLDVLLLFSLVGSLATFCVFSPNQDATNARYLMPALVFSIVLTGRQAASLFSAVKNKITLQAIAAVAVAITALFAIDVAHFVSTPVPVSPVATLTSFLKNHQLTLGVGDYWSASIVSVDSSGSVKVRPVVPRAGKLERDDRQSPSSWYAGKLFEFFVYDTSHHTRGVSSAIAIATFGKPSQTYAVGTYQVLVWPQSLVISPKLPVEKSPIRFD